MFALFGARGEQARLTLNVIKGLDKTGQCPAVNGVEMAKGEDALSVLYLPPPKSLRYSIWKKEREGKKGEMRPKEGKIKRKVLYKAAG